MAVACANDRHEGRSVYLALELGADYWKLAIGDGVNVSDKGVKAGDIDGVLRAVAAFRRKNRLGEGTTFSCYEAGRDGFWIHRELVERGVASEVVDSSSIEVNRRERQAKSDKLDARRLVRLLMRAVGGERDVWRTVKVPTSQDEDDRRPVRERQRLKMEATAISNRARGLLMGVGVRLTRGQDVFAAPDDLRQPDGKPLPPNLVAELHRDGRRVSLIRSQIAEIERALRSRTTQAARLERTAAPSCEQVDENATKVRMLTALVGVGATSSWCFVTEFFGWRNFRNAREVGACAGLVPMPWLSGHIDKVQGISKAGNSRVRSMATELAWLWLRYQPQSALAQWYERKFGAGGSRVRRIGIVALARKLLIAFWRYLEFGVVPDGARLKPA